ncbi:hypothetical protein Y032_0133g1789 [Ancylostoma ceylanicum]|uniref:Uncharacterized protein n=1 Tax=Ancylostoma ceylanicum TaxID=53326 RepID=A0A016T5J1_9BILA|nr:hypothetical protein Y032_0133g1789 [Ancylostoma ceylanicum]
MQGLQEYVKNLEDAALRHVSNCERTAPEHDPPVGESFWRGGSGSYQLSHVEAMKQVALLIPFFVYRNCISRFAQAMKEWWGPLESIGLGDKLDYTAEVQEGPLKYFAIVCCTYILHLTISSV